MTRGERRLAERLEAKLEADYLIWFDVPVGQKKRHPDFILFHPRRGVLVLEVKDWKTDTIHSIDRAQVGLQSRQFAQQVADLLQRDALLVNSSDDPYRGRLCFPWSFGVVLPFI